MKSTLISCINMAQNMWLDFSIHERHAVWNQWVRLLDWNWTGMTFGYVVYNLNEIHRPHSLSWKLINTYPVSSEAQNITLYASSLVPRLDMRGNVWLQVQILGGRTFAKTRDCSTPTMWWDSMSSPQIICLSDSLEKEQKEACTGCTPTTEMKVESLLLILSRWRKTAPAFYFIF